MFIAKPLWVALMIASVISAVGCTGKPHARRHHPRPHSTAGYDETGMASWYGPGFRGRRTASGERFNPQAMTCAHRTLPFGTQLKVTNLQNERTLVLRVNDRGPFIRGRIVDVSKAAAHKLGFLGQGHTKVRLERID